MTPFVSWNRRWRDGFFLGLILAWCCVHFSISAHRSMWQDELTRYVQMQMPLIEALRSLFNEPSPFTPGEIFLGFVSKIIFGKFTEFEFWGRVPAVLWGAGTLLLAYGLRRYILFFFLLFSVSLTAFSAQFRPYSVLIFDAALGILILERQREFSRRDFLFLFLAVFFGHLYGIVFLGAAFLFKRHFRAALFCGLYLGLVTACFYLVHQKALIVWSSVPNKMDFHSVLEWLARIYTTPFLQLKRMFLIVFGIGLLAYLKRNGKAALHISLLFLLTLILPLSANAIGNYPFTPRHMVGGLFPFLFLVDEGFTEFFRTIKLMARNAYIPTKLASLAGVLVFSGIVGLPWVRSWRQYVIEGTPPFVEQPLHRYYDRALQSLADKDKSALLIDPGGLGYHYYVRVFGPAFTKVVEKHAGHDWVVYHWPAQEFSLYLFDESEFAWKDLNEIAELPAFQKFVQDQEPRFDRLIYNCFEFRFPNHSGLKMLRAW